MQYIIIEFGYLLQVLIGSTACESLSAAANIFLGMSESPLLIEPYLRLMTKSELFTVMTSGFATIAGAVLAAYISFGVFKFALYFNSFKKTLIYFKLKGECKLPTLCISNGNPRFFGYLKVILP